MHLTAALTEFRYAKDLTPASHRWYDQKLTAFIGWLQEQGVTDLEGITAPLVRRYIDYRRSTPTPMGGVASSQTVHGHVRAIRAWLFWAAGDDLIDERVPKRIALPKKEQKVLAVLSERQLALLFQEAKRTDTPLRDTAILSLLLDTGMRASELCGLELADVTFTTDDAWLLIRHGKGRKQREVGLGKRSRAALHRYIHRERHAPTSERHVFLGRKGPLKPEGLDRLLYRLRDEAGAEHFAGVSVGAHRWRHTSATRALEAGSDIFAVSKMLGHSDIGVTTGYLRAVNARKLRQLAISPLDTLGT